MAEKAKKLLGYEYYYDVSVEQEGKPMDYSSPYYKSLIKKAEEINEKINTDIDFHYKKIKTGTHHIEKHENDE